MNRLVIVGNGFDLAHGLKTGYNDFIVWYIKNCLQSAHENGIYEDSAIKVKGDKNVRIQVGNNIGISAFIDYFYQLGKLERLIYDPTFHESYMYYPNPFNISIKHDFILKIIAGCSITQWVDIENIYYECLRVEIDVQGSTRPGLDSLNSAMSELILQLTNYLNTLLLPRSITGYLSILRSKIMTNDLVDQADEKEIAAENTMVLNFNYTSTIEQYLTGDNIDVNYIHGKLDDENNPLIFGYGDELDKNYEEFERNRSSGRFKYIKSFWYFRTRNYHNLIRFIQGNTYQVVILGHSCGLSDRTMLNMIFEDPNCKSVKIYHHVTQDGKDNYTDITYALSVHFKNKQEMRKKIVPFNKDSFMPQSKLNLVDLVPGGKINEELTPQSNI